MTLFDSSMRTAMIDVNGSAAPGTTIRFLAFCNDADTGLFHKGHLVGHSLFSCTSLTKVDCAGLTQIVQIGDGWLCGCTSLTALDCTGLTQLATVGKDWLYGCTSLTAVDCTELTHLPLVGGSLLRGCTSSTALAR